MAAEISDGHWSWQSWAEIMPTRTDGIARDGRTCKGGHLWGQPFDTIGINGTDHIGNMLRVVLCLLDTPCLANGQVRYIVAERGTLEVFRRGESLKNVCDPSRIRGKRGTVEPGAAGAVLVARGGLPAVRAGAARARQADHHRPGPDGRRDHIGLRATGPAAARAAARRARPLPDRPAGPHGWGLRSQSPRGPAADDVA